MMMLSRGGRVNTIHGNLELIDDAMGAWMARAFSTYLPLLSLGRTNTFGGIPGEVEPYEFASLGAAGSLYTVVNPSQAVRSIELRQLAREQAAPAHGRILFRDAGYVPVSGRRVYFAGSRTEGCDRVRKVRASRVRHGGWRTKW